MSEFAFALFDTVLGRCGLAWSEAGVSAVSFAHSDDVATGENLCRRAPGAEKTDAPPAIIRRHIADIGKLFAGKAIDLSHTELDLRGIGEFEREVYALTLEILPGQTKTYGELARALGDVSLSRRIGQALGCNPFPIIVPCHRVLGADGAMIGFSAPGGAELKRKLLKIEGALAPDLFDLP